MISLDCEILCDGCGVVNLSKITTNNVSQWPSTLDGIQITSWNIGKNNEFENWGFLWSVSGEYWKEKLFCPPCYIREKSLIPKKKSILERFSDLFKGATK